MSTRNQQLNRILWLVGAIGGSLMLGLPTLAQTNTNQPVPNAQRYQPQQGDSMQRRDNQNPNQNMNSDRMRSNTMQNGQSTPNNSMNRMDNRMMNSDRNNNRNQTRSNQLNNRTGSALNPCPSIFYEPQFRSALPAGCPVNQISGNTDVNTSPATNSPQRGDRNLPSQPIRIVPSQPNPAPQNNNQGMNNQSANPTTNSTQNSATIPSLQEQLGDPSARVNLTNGVANVRIINSTGANVRYQVIGDTNQRLLPGKSNVDLQALRAPTTITFDRADRGLLSVTTYPASEQGSLEVVLTEAARLGADKKALNIQATGEVYLY